MRPTNREICIDRWKENREYDWPPAATYVVVPEKKNIQFLHLVQIKLSYPPFDFFKK